MSTYTIQLKTLIEGYTQDQENLSHRERIEIGRKQLFDFPYPIFDEAYKRTFETNLIRTFYSREIGFETEGLFKFNLETWLLVNMSYYNQLYESQNLKFNPLLNVEMNETNNRKKDRDEKVNQSSNTTGKSTSSSNASSTSSGESFNRDIKSDTPDSRLQLSTEDGKGIIEYASAIDESKENAKNTNTGKSDDTTNNDVKSLGNQTNESNEVEDYISHKVGKVGSTSYSKLVMEYRESFLRIENQIFKELQQLFMLVY